MNRLFFDLETSHNIGVFFQSGYKINIPYQNILHERKIICIGYKWEGKQEKVISWDKDQDERSMLLQFIPILNEADEIVAHFGDGFDMPYLRTRCAFHGIKMRPSYITIDTCKWANRYFHFNSAKLDYLAIFFGLGGKIKTEPDLWLKVLIDNSRSALHRMMKYCGVDVALLESVFHKMEPMVPHSTHQGVLKGLPKWTCAKCGSKHVKKSKTRITAAGSKQFQMNCLDCGGYYSVNQSSYNAYELVSSVRKSTKGKKVQARL